MSKIVCKCNKLEAGNMLYISRDFVSWEYQVRDTVDIWRDKPYRETEGNNIFYDSKTCEKTRLSLDDFKKLYGYIPRKGRCSRVIFLVRKH